MKIALAQIDPIIGDVKYNLHKMISFIEKGKTLGAQLFIFPEMSLLGYPPQDLLLQKNVIEELDHALATLVAFSKDIHIIVGTVRKNLSFKEKDLFNTAAIISCGKLLGYQDKMLLPNYDVFSERRYFEPGTYMHVWTLSGKKVGVTICEDIWQHAGAAEYISYAQDPVLLHASNSLDVLVNLSASPFYLQRRATRVKVCERAVATLKCPLFLCNQVGGNDSLIFDGQSCVFNEKGEAVIFAKAFQEDLVCLDTDNLPAPASSTSGAVEELYQALVLGIKDYFQKLGFSKACFGLSGGIDSAVVACLAKEALGADNVLALSLPSRYTTDRSLNDARDLAARLKVPFQELSIETPFQSFLGLLEPYFEGKPFDTTEENLQARIRGMILMAFSNKFNYLVLSTGNKSEMAMGYCTLYGDMCGGLAVLSDVTKTWVYALARWINRDEEIIPESILIKAPSAELRYQQKDTDSLPDYAIVDKVLEDFVENHLSPQEIASKHSLSKDLVYDLVRRIHQNEYKRRQAPPGLRVTKKAFTVGRCFPIVQHWDMHEEEK